jgi:hypothetical protein
MDLKVSIALLGNYNKMKYIHKMIIEPLNE